MVMGKRLRFDRPCLIYTITFALASGAFTALLVCGFTVVDEYRITREYFLLIILYIQGREIMHMIVFINPSILGLDI